MRSFQFSRVIRRSRQHARHGLLTFEWVLIFAMLAVGVVGGLAAVRDAMNISYGSVAGAAMGLDASYIVKPYVYTHTLGSSANQAALSFQAVGMKFIDDNSEDDSGNLKPATNPRSVTVVTPTGTLTPVSYP